MQEKFHWTSPNGVEIVVPHLNKIKAGLLRRHRRRDELDMVFSILEDVLDDEMLEKLDDLDQGDLEAFSTAWQKSGASVGESSRSST